MSREIDVYATCTPAQFGKFVKMPATEVNQLVRLGVLPERGTYADMAGAYIEHLSTKKNHPHSLDANPYPEHSYLHRAFERARGDARCTQAEFGARCDLSQPAVSKMIQKGVLHPEGTFLAWFDDYVTHLQHEARKRTGRG
jgi:hypothetical protein